MILCEWGAEYLPTELLHKRELFISYLAEAWQSHLTTSIEQDEREIDDEEEQAQKQNKQRFFSFTYDGKIAARNYVGVVHYEGNRIQVIPKLYNVPYDLKQCNLNLLCWLSYCKRFQFPYSLAGISDTPFDDLLEMLIWIFARHAEEIMTSHPYQAYQEVKEETGYLRGQLLFDEYVRDNLSTGRWQHFYCRYQPFVYDNLFNRIVKCVARKLSNLTSEGINKSMLDNILFILDDVSDIQCRAGDCDRVRLNPLYYELQIVLDGCRMFLSESVTDTSDEQSHNFCFLVPMEKVFEDFVFGFLKSEFGYLNPLPQKEIYLAQNARQNVFKMKHDILFPGKLIVDTKYKLRDPGNDAKGGVAQSDMYQMLAYSLRRNVDNILLLYPERGGENLSIPTCFFVTPEINGRVIRIEVRNLQLDVEDVNAFSIIMKNRFGNLLSQLKNSNDELIFQEFTIILSASAC